MMPMPVVMRETLLKMSARGNEIAPNEARIAEGQMGFELEILVFGEFRGVQQLRPQFVRFVHIATYEVA